MPRAVVFGAGMVGAAIAADLAADDAYEVVVADRRPEALAALAIAHGVETEVVDLADADQLARLAKGADVALGALPGALGYQTLEAVVKTGTKYCDISFMPEDYRPLSALAEQHGTVAVVDCGVAPGVSNMLAGYAAKLLSPCDRLAIYVGGLPVVRKQPYEYKAGFSPHDVIEEYVRPARMVIGGEEVVKEALTEIETIDFPHVGTLEAFNTDGLRSLIHTLGVPDMSEKTMRYPGHAAKMAMLRDSGFFSLDTIRVGDHLVKPRDLTAALLFPMWEFQPNEEDMTVMRVEAWGRMNDRPAHIVWDLFDRFDAATATRSMSRVTAFPATIVARWLCEGRFSEAGVHPPEKLIRQDGLMDDMFAALRARGVSYKVRTEPSDLLTT